MSEPVVVIGAGGHAKVIVGLLRALGREVDSCLDSNPALWGKDVLGVRVGAPPEELVPGTQAVLAIGSNRTRRALAPLRYSWQTLVHPRAFVDPTAMLGVGTVVFAGAVIQPAARIGAHVIINTGATVDHDCTIGDYVHLAPGVTLAGAVQVREGAFLGVGASVIPGRVVGAWATVGAGATVVRDLAPDVTAVGLPARPITRRS